MYRDLMLDQEIVRLNEQHKRELNNHQITLSLMRAELRSQKEAQQLRDSEILELKP